MKEVGRRSTVRVKCRVSWLQPREEKMQLVLYVRLAWSAYKYAQFLPLSGPLHEHYSINLSHWVMNQGSALIILWWCSLLRVLHSASTGTNSHRVTADSIQLYRLEQTLEHALCTQKVCALRLIRLWSRSNFWILLS